MQKVIDVSQDQIDAWKKKYGVVKQVSVTKKDGTPLEFIIVKPTTEVLDQLKKYDGDGKEHKVREVLINSCIMAGTGSELEGVTGPEVRAAVFEKIFDCIDKLQATEKEL